MTLTSLFALATILSLSFAIAASLDITKLDIPANIDHDAGSFVMTFDVENTGVEDAGIDLSITSPSGDYTVTFSENDFPMGDGTSDKTTKTIAATVNFDSNQAGTIAGTINAVPTDFSGGDDTETFSVSINPESDISITESQELTKTQDGELTIENTGNVALNVDLSVSTGSFTVELDDENFALPAGTEKTVSVTLLDSTGLDFGDNTLTITAEDTTQSVSDTVDITLEDTFCKSGSVGNDLRLKDVKIDNSGEGSDDEWNLLDVITVEVEVKNDGNDDVDDVFVELALFDSTGKNVADELDFMGSDDEEVDLGKIRDGKDDLATFEFKIPGDFDDGTYSLTVKAYSDDLGENVECVDSSDDLSDDTFEKISIERESDEGKFITLDEMELRPNELTCGDTAILSMNVVNVGDEDQEQTRINLRSTELDLDLFEEIRKDLDPGDDATLEFSFVVPSVESGSYILKLSSDYAYDNGDYDESSDEDTTFLLNVAGCGIGPGTTPGRVAAITASLDSDAKAGSDLVVRSSITNLKDTSADFVVDASGFESWASLNSISNRIISLEAGETREVTFNFAADSGAAGQQSFTVEVRSGTDLETRQVSVNIEGAADGGTSFGGDNTLIWIIGIVNVILIILIIIVAVRISQR